MAEEKNDDALEDFDVIDRPAETFETQQAGEQREAFIKRNKEAIAARREILLRNGALDDTEGADPTAIEGRCCS
jgi:hypothetical protein